VCDCQHVQESYKTAKTYFVTTTRLKSTALHLNLQLFCQIYVTNILTLVCRSHPSWLFCFLRGSVEMSPVTVTFVQCRRNNFEMISAAEIILK